MVYLHQDAEQTAFLFQQGKVVFVLPFHGRLNKSVKSTWLAHEPDAVIVIATNTARKIMVSTSYVREGLGFACTGRSSLAMRLESETLEVINRKQQQIDLSAMHYKTQSEYNRVIFVYENGHSIISDRPINMNESHNKRRYLTGDVSMYRTLSFFTFLVKEKNVVRWSMSVRDKIRIGSSFSIIRNRMVSFPITDNDVQPGTVLPFPENFLDYVPKIDVPLVHLCCG